MKIKATLFASVLALAVPTSAFALTPDAGSDAGSDAGQDSGVPADGGGDATVADGGGTDGSTTGDASTGDDASTAGDDDDDDSDASTTVCSADPLCAGKSAMDKCGADNAGVCVASTCAGAAILTCGDFVMVTPDASTTTTADGSTSSGDSSSDDGGCNVGGSSDPAAAFALLGLVLPFLTRRRKNKRA